ncbi:hypothetical protein B0H11DRAFT_2228734 [Mycena galericulata]|nr:hypothetical protein B0H11DRAFT_2228734 [Mycena galericulata]
MEEENMSDEASGPEDDNVEGFSNWKRRMATSAEYGDVAPAAFAKLHFLEVLEADWRSEKLTNLFVDVHGHWWDSLSVREKSAIKYIRVRGSGRSSKRVPKVAPFNFGVSQPWLDRHKFDPELQALLADWNSHPDPIGFCSTVGASSTAGELLTATSSADTGSHTLIDPSLPSSNSADNVRPG